MSLMPFDDRDGWIWMDGKMVPWRDAQAHVLTHGLHYASGVFEGERVYDERIFKLTEHTERLFKSADILGFEIPFSVAEIDAACDAVVAKNGIVDGYVRPIAWRGSEMMGVSAQQNTIHVAIAAWEWPAYFSPEARMRGLKMRISDWRRPDPRTAPVFSKAAGLYMICTMSKHQAEAEGYHDALLLDWRGNISEATGANVFFQMDDGKLHTPTPDCFLDGITRRTVIDLAERKGMDVVTRHIEPEEMSRASEAFLTGTAVEVTPIASIGDYNFNPGRVCETLMTAYDEEVRRKTDDAALISGSAA